MIIASKKETFRILKEHNLIAKKGYGQNFIITPSVIDNIVNNIAISEQTLVIEIGPGLGALTQKLLDVSKKIIAIEIDKKMVEVLKENLNDHNLEIINEDFLKVDLDELISKEKSFDEVIIVSNLPYYITTDILEKIIALNDPKIKKIVAMMQKEVGKKLLKKEDKIESYLKVLIDNYCDTKVVTYVSKNDFEPRPSIDSIVLEFSLNKNKYDLNDDFFAMVKKCLENRRKTLINTLPLEKDKVLNLLSELKIKETIRIEELDIKTFKKIVEMVKEYEA